MIYNYDGSLDGFFTVIFEKYKEIGKCEISQKVCQQNFLASEFVESDPIKAQRVINTIKENMGYDFFSDLIKVFKSNNENKEEIIAITIKSTLLFGNVYLVSAKKSAVAFSKIVKNFNHEVHAYKGLLRFREIQDGFLLGEIEAANDIIWHLAYHFVKRMPNEKFIIYDKNRKKAIISEKASCEEVEILDLDPEETRSEKIFKEAWLGFYKAIGIEERKNYKLMVNNMPKKYWKYLPEKNNSSI